MNTVDKMIEVLQAILEGKTVQWSYPGAGDWTDCKSPITPNFGVYEYRVKKEPRRHWCVDYTCIFFGEVQSTTVLYKTLEAAQNFIKGTKSPHVASMYTKVSEPYEVVEVMK